jgi:DNA-binding NarL/FixJ family response regulator
MGQKHRVILVEDQTIMREGLRALLAEFKEFDIVGEAEDGLIAIKSIEKLQPDLVLTDLSMPRMNGTDMIATIKRQSPKTKVIALTVHADEEYVLQTLKAGADGYILKEAHYDELIMAIRSVLNGKHYISPEISGKLLDGYLREKNSIPTHSRWETLTTRERQILKLIAEGYSSREIANFLCISVKTVDKHRSNLMTKLDIHNAAALVTLAVEKGLRSK